MAERLLENGKWKETLDIVKKSAVKNPQCHEYQCDPTIDGRNL